MTGRNPTPTDPLAKRVGYQPVEPLRQTRRCGCPIRCTYCGAKLTRDCVGHRCPSKNCQWEHGASTCTLHEQENDA